MDEPQRTQVADATFRDYDIKWCLNLHQQKNKYSTWMYMAPFQIFQNVFSENGRNAYLQWAPPLNVYILEYPWNRCMKTCFA